MLMTAVHHHMDSSSSASPPPWLPVLPLPGHHHPPLHDDDFTASPASAPPCRATAPPPAPPPSNSNQPQHQHLLPRRVARRRPRPSRRLPITYISADAASFRRMVHQVTGADDLLTPQPSHSSSAAAGGRATTLVRPAPPVRGDPALMPTLDTSAAAFLVEPPSRTTDDNDGSAPALEVGVGRACTSTSSTGGGFFPTLESSWDHHALF